MHTFTALVLTLTTSFLLLAPSEVQAKIYKCKGTDGSVSYSQSPCAGSEQTSKIMSEKTARESFDCRVARAFSSHVADEMKAGLSSEDVFDQYGGINSITPTTMSVINYVFSHKGNAAASVHRISALSGARCDTGAYSRELGCEHFPPSFIEGKGGCDAIKSQSPIANHTQNNGKSVNHNDDEGRSGYRSVAGLDNEPQDNNRVQVKSSDQRNANYNVRQKSAGEKQNECRVAVRKKISDLQERMRGRLSMEVHERLSDERRSLRDSYEAC